MRSFYCVFYDDDNSYFDVFGPISDDTLFTDSVLEIKNKGLNVHCNTVMVSDVMSIEDLKKDRAPEGYKYYDGLIQKFGIEW